MMRRNRNWVVLYREGGDDSNLWRQITASYAPTARAAIDQATAGDFNPYREGTFRAIPVKAWGHEITIPPKEYDVPGAGQAGC